MKYITRPYDSIAPGMEPEKGSRLTFEAAFLLASTLSAIIFLGIGEGAYKAYRTFQSAGRETSLTATPPVRSTQSIDAKFSGAAQIAAYDLPVVN